MTHNKEQKEKKDKDLKLKEVHKAWGQAEADVIKSLLESHGIPCSFRGRIAQFVYPFTADGLGEIKVFVPEEDYELAKALLENKVKEDDSE
jgi:hypothetical protein